MALLNVFSSQWCISRRLGFFGMLPHFSQIKPLRSIISRRIRISIDDEGRLYSLPCFHAGLSAPVWNILAGGFAFFASDIFFLASSEALRPTCAAEISALCAFFVALIFAIDSFVCSKPFLPCRKINLFQPQLCLFHDTRSPQPHAQKGASLSGSIFLAEGSPRILWPWIYPLPLETRSPQPHLHNDSIFSFIFDIITQVRSKSNAVLKRAAYCPKGD